jgi:hypothetical protein
MKFSTKTIEMIGKAVAEEMKRCGYNSGDNLYEVENGMRELQRQIGVAGLATFLEQADEALQEEVKASACQSDYYFHSYRPAVIWSVFGKVRIERRYYTRKERDCLAGSKDGVFSRTSESKFGGTLSLGRREYPF